MSHPMRVRGLKLFLSADLHLLVRVAPHAGAWIETICFEKATTTKTSHPMRVRGLKLLEVTATVMKPSRTPCGCVD